MNLTVEIIERKRSDAGVSILEMSRRAGVAPSTYWFIRRGKVTPKAETLEKYDRALSLAPKLKKPTKLNDLTMAAYRGYLAFFATKLGFDPEAVAANPKSRAYWDVRALALNATSTEHNIGCAELARAVGESKQLVHWRIRKGEDFRDDPAVDDHARSAARVIAGRDE